MRTRLSLIVTFALALALTAHAAERPRLIVVISIDQFRYEYLERFAPWFASRGFNRFLKSGANFANANYKHASTFTGPGHASIGTGRTPAETGIIGNNWLDRSAPYDAQEWEAAFDEWAGYPAAKPAKPAPAGTKPWWSVIGGVPRYCVYDNRVRVSAGTTPGMSPANLDSDSLADRVKESNPKSKVIAAAIKDRAAILMGGRKADAAYWFDPKIPGFISSSYYRYDSKLFAFNASVLSYVPASKQWTLSSTIPAADLNRITFDPPQAWPLKTPRYGTTFPHSVPDARALTYTPFANDMLLDFASNIVDQEKLGADDDPDLLYVGVSAPDYIGHYYGPDSMEVADDAVRLDRSLERFLDKLEKQVGASRLVVAITADHGVQSHPEIAKLRDPSLDAGRTDLRNAKREAWSIAEMSPLRVELERRLCDKLHVPFDADGPLTDALIFYFEEPSLYLNWPRVRALKLDGEEVKRALRDIIVSMRDAGFDRAFTNSELLAVNHQPDPIERAVRASFRADRSGDVLVTLKKNWIWRYSDTNATHGQPLPDDRHVPLLFWGAGIRAGRYTAEAAPTDLATTLGAILGVKAGAVDSKILPCAPDEVRVTEVAMREVAKAAARVQSIDVKGDAAHITIVIPDPPQPPAKPGMISMSCGTRYMFTLQRDASGEWVITQRGIAQC